MKQQRIARPKAQVVPQIIDNRQPTVPEPQAVTGATNLPLRTVLYVEVGDAAPEYVQRLVQEINRVYEGARGGIHYVIPVRNGRIGTDVIFEQEILNMVRQICEVKDGEIVLKNDATECNIIRQQL